MYLLAKAETSLVGCHSLKRLCFSETIWPAFSYVSLLLNRSHWQLHTPFSMNSHGRDGMIVSTSDQTGSDSRQVRVTLCYETVPVRTSYRELVAIFRPSSSRYHAMD